MKINIKLNKNFLNKDFTKYFYNNNNNNIYLGYSLDKILNKYNIYN